VPKIKTFLKGKRGGYSFSSKHFHERKTGGPASPEAGRAEVKEERKNRPEVKEGESRAPCLLARKEENMKGAGGPLRRRKK